MARLFTVLAVNVHSLGHSDRTMELTLYFLTDLPPNQGASIPVESTVIIPIAA
ncbi:MAG TPA: hypothetical protein VGM92_05815 [Candidatus Kapabacteria bacterium]